MQRNQKFTTTITIPVMEYERLIKASAHLETIINTPTYNLQATAEAIKAALARAEQADEAGADL